MYKKQGNYLFSGDNTQDSVLFESPNIFQSQTQQQIQAQFQSKIQFSSIVKNSFGIPREVNNPQVLQTKMSKATAKIVPPPDTFSKKKRKSDDELTEAYIKQSEGLNNLAMQVSQTLLAKNNPEPYASALDPIVGAIHLALTKVKDADKFDCMLDVLQYINEKYVKNKK